MNTEKAGPNFLAAIVLGLALIVCSIIGAWAVIRLKSDQQTVVVTGSARKRIRSDLIVWRAMVSHQAPQLSEAYQGLTTNVPRVKAYLVSKGVPEDQIVISSITTRTIRARSGSDDAGGEPTGPIVAYALQQQLEIRSTEVDKITKISREVTELINQGILLESFPPEYHYTKLGDLKIEMLGEAARDAKIRAQQIAASTDNEVGDIRAARMGVLQITPPDSNQVSDYGINDTSSLDKDITAVVNISFAVE